MNNLTIHGCFRNKMLIFKIKEPENSSWDLANKVKTCGFEKKGKTAK
jgi:hypothetical protein